MERATVKIAESKKAAHGGLLPVLLRFPEIQIL